MMLSQLIAIEPLWYTNDNVFVQFLISTFICSVSHLSSFKYAKGTCRITKKHTFMPFCGEELSSVATSLNDSQFCLPWILHLTWNVHLQIEVMKTGRGLS